VGPIATKLLIAGVGGGGKRGSAKRRKKAIPEEDTLRCFFCNKRRGVIVSRSKRVNSA